MSTPKSRTEKAKKNEDLFRDSPSYKNKRLRLTLPLPPSVNHMYVNTRGGGKQLTSRAKSYVRDSRALINLAVEEQHWLKQEYAVWLYVDLVFYMPDRRIRDSHNMLKLLLDVMQDIVFENDYYVLPRIQAVEYDPNNPRVEACITPQNSLARERAARITS